MVHDGLVLPLHAPAPQPVKVAPAIGDEVKLSESPSNNIVDWQVMTLPGPVVHRSNTSRLMVP